MKDKDSFQQCYNGQAAVDTVTMLIVGQHLTNAPNDKEQLIPSMAAIDPAAGKISRVLVDSGFYSDKAVTAVETDKPGLVVYAAQKRQPHGRSIEQLEKRPDPPTPPPNASPSELMAHRLATAAGTKLYAQRKQTVEPVFGIIKSAMGFRRFMLRGLEKAGLEWSLVCAAYNLKRLYVLNSKQRTA